jgi:hypothetical protein
MAIEMFFCSTLAVPAVVFCGIDFWDSSSMIVRFAETEEQRASMQAHNDDYWRHHSA